MSYHPQGSDNNQYAYEMKGTSIGNLQKLRIGVGEFKDAENFYIKKMRLENRSTKTMVRFPSVDTEFEKNQVYEFSPVYPDIQPTPNILYTITLTTSASTGSFYAVINIIGEEGDSGMRKFHDEDQFTQGSHRKFDVDAINLGPLKEVDVLIEGDENSSWIVDIVVGMADNSTQYATNLVTIPAPDQLVRFALQQR
ncbi:hypothetical protein KIN20_013757 [Parelaphostrongylus tenuis]|uniref:PLAT domain-containing protein n=1 Tax=Parelaphostrongylus tenuis TaxID=148309 RepID=A0AAD5QL77_PARTN|nr:hypothetical protein KIN20_013757 [Parelaphostrongylus tenuis]